MKTTKTIVCSDGLRLMSGLNHGELTDELAHFAAAAIYGSVDGAGAEWAMYVTQVVRSLKDGH